MLFSSLFFGRLKNLKERNWNLFSYFLTEAYVKGTQKNYIIEMAL